MNEREKIIVKAIQKAITNWLAEGRRLFKDYGVKLEKMFNDLWVIGLEGEN